jgi:hypothetical protein
VKRNPPCLSAADDAGKEDDDKPRHQQHLNMDQKSQILFYIYLTAVSFIVKVIARRRELQIQDTI